MPIFKFYNESIKQLKINSFKNEKELQNLVEGNLEEIFGIKFIKTEHDTGEKHKGRIDSLGLDENNSPVIIEYKWGENENVINQGLFYLDWLMDHKGDFQMLVDNKLKQKINIDWKQPRLILIAGSFNKYDLYAINRMAENIELYTYTLYEDGFLNIEIVGSTKGGGEKETQKVTKVDYSGYDLNYHLNKTVEEFKNIFLEIREKLLEFPESKEIVEQKSGVTYRTSRSYVRFEFKKNSIDMLLKSPKYVDPKNLVRDVSAFGWGYKGLVKIQKNPDIDYLISLIQQSYKETL